MHSLHSLLAKAAGLEFETKPLWGNMTPQHMIEHLIDSVKLSNGKLNVPLLVSPEQAATLQQQILFSSDAFPRNIENPLVQLGSYRAPSLAVALQRLHTEVNDFIQYWEQANATPLVHPFFSALNYEGWLRFHEKHFTHHFTQFSLLA